MQRGFALPLVLVVVLLIGLIGVGGYYLYQTKTPESISTIPSPSSKVDETANWKTYTNQDNKFNFKYPESYDIEVSDTNENVFLKPKGLTAQEAQKLGKYYILFGPESNPRTIEEYASLAQTIGIESKITYLNINNEPALAWLYKMGSAGGGSLSDKIHKQYYIYSRDLGVGFEDSGVLNSDHTLLDKIVATFKFLDDETEKWKTYTKYGFSIKYPSALSIETLPENAPDFFQLKFPEEEGYLRIEAHEITPFILSNEIELDMRRANSAKTTFHSKPAVSFRPARNTHPGEPFKGLIVYDEEKKSKYIVAYFGDGTNEYQYDQILATFQLTN